jgi:hypothetical protein
MGVHQLRVLSSKNFICFKLCRWYLWGDQLHKSHQKGKVEMASSVKEWPHLTSLNQFRNCSYTNIKDTDTAKGGGCMLPYQTTEQTL